MTILSGLYLLVALSFFGTLFEGFKKTTDLSAEQRDCSLKVMTLAAVFWPVVIPIAYLEKRSKAKQELYHIYKSQESQVPMLPELETSQVVLLPEFEIKSEAQEQQESVKSFVA